ncbi:MAG: NAD(P)-binding domain-containing protein, partial [Acidimicrobiaceae bacterium]
MERHIAVVGAGSWGTTVANAVVKNQATILWARRSELAEKISTSHENDDYLPGVNLAESLRCSSVLQDVVTNASIVMMAVPSNGFRAVATEVAKFVAGDVPIVSLAKGLERETLKRMSEV